MTLQEEKDKLLKVDRHASNSSPRLSALNVDTRGEADYDVMNVHSLHWKTKYRVTEEAHQ